WSILGHAFPSADVPVLQMSIDPRRPGTWHYNLGRELLHLRRRGVLIIGSGNIVHNPREADLELAYDGFEWAIEADEVLKAKIRAVDHGALCEHETLGRAVSLAVPTPDHYYPLLHVLGMQTPEDKVTIFNDALAYGSVTMTSLRLGA
ncbi:MAG: dioxygenase, partial [Isosphaeraceae bacterium]